MTYMDVDIVTRDFKIILNNMNPMLFICCLLLNHI
jgi:hypothetical protein